VPCTAQVGGGGGRAGGERRRRALARRALQRQRRGRPRRLPERPAAGALRARASAALRALGVWGRQRRRALGNQLSGRLQPCVLACVQRSYMEHACSDRVCRARTRRQGLHEPGALHARDVPPSAGARLQGIDLDDDEWAAFASGIERLALQKERSQHFRPFQVPARAGRRVPGRMRRMLAGAEPPAQPGANRPVPSARLALAACRSRSARLPRDGYVVGYRVRVHQR